MRVRPAMGGAKLQKAVYNELRVLFGLGAQMACNVPRQVSATYKTLWTKVKQSADAIAKGCLLRSQYIELSRIKRANSV
jgi:hypothetical protein